MIVIFGHKDFKKFWKEKQNRKGFVGHHPNEPLIVDGTDGDSSVLNQMSQAFSLMGFSAGGKLLNGSKRADPTLEMHIRPAEVKKAKKKFFKSSDFRKGVVSIAKTFVENKGKMNIAVIITQDAYDALGKDYIKNIIKLLHLKKKNENLDDIFAEPPKFDDLDDIFDVTKKADVFFTYKDLKRNPDLLQRVPNKKEIKALAKGIDKLMDDINDSPYK